MTAEWNENFHYEKRIFYILSVTGNIAACADAIHRVQ